MFRHQSGKTSFIIHMLRKRFNLEKEKMVKSKAFIIAVDYDDDLHGNFDLNKTLIENAITFYLFEALGDKFKRVDVDELGFMDLDTTPDSDLFGV